MNPISYPCSPGCPASLITHLARPVYQVHTVVAGGTPGWQIALIAHGAALAAALAAAAAAVTADRARTARRMLG